MRLWRLVWAKTVSAPKITLFADIYEDDKLIAEKVDFTEATKIVQAHNKEIKNVSS